MKSFNWRGLLIPMFAAAIGGTGASLSGADVTPFVTEIGALVGALAGLLFNKVGTAGSGTANGLAHPNKERGFIQANVMLCFAFVLGVGVVAEALGYVQIEAVAFLACVVIAVLLSLFVVRTAWATRPEARLPIDSLRYVDVYASGRTARASKNGKRSAR